MEIDDANLRQFERIARKYGVDYAVRKDVTTETPRFLVFFKGRDADAIMAALKEFSSAKERKSSARRCCKSCERLCQSRAHQKSATKSLSDEH